MARKFFIHYSFLSSFLLATPVVYTLVNDKKNQNIYVIISSIETQSYWNENEIRTFVN